METDELPFDEGLLISIFGKTKSGKSKLALSIFKTYPGDRVVIDVAGDDGPWGDGVIELTGTVADGQLPDKWPSYRRTFDDDGRPKPMTLRYVPDAGSATFAEDIDRVIGMAYDKENACILIHEIGVVAPVNQVQPNMRRLLMHGRHHQVTAICCGPRSKEINHLVLGQARLMMIFELQMQGDRDRIADNIGWDKKAFSDGVEELRRHEYLLFDAGMEKPEEGEVDRRLIHCPALPEAYVKQVTRWAEGNA